MSFEVRKLLQVKDNIPDLENQRKELREQPRRMRIGYERGMYQEDEHVFWREVETIQEKLRILELPHPDAINKAADTLLNLNDSWAKATLEEQRELTQMMLQEVGCSVHENKSYGLNPDLVSKSFSSWSVNCS
jgi:hypothetical protein